jgi:hypothetical protein
MVTHAELNEQCSNPPAPLLLGDSSAGSNEFNRIVAAAMSIELVNAEIAKFLTSAEPAVLCLRGRWGVGKTFTWDEQFKAAQNSKRLALKDYAYVSLFGINSLDSLKFTILENSQNVERAIQIPGFDTFNEYIAKAPGWKRISSTLANSPLLARFVDRGTIQGILFSRVSRQIICIDDFERRGDGLTPKDVLGLISSLKEQRGCKVALILNDEKFGGDARSEFETHLEKVVDISLVFEPSAFRVAAIGAGQGSETSAYVGDRSSALGITNIRTVRRASRFVETLEPLLARFDPEVLRTAIKSLVLFCWCRDQPQDAPSLDFVRKMRADIFGLETRRARGDSESVVTRWATTLHAYDYMWTDEFDLVLIEAVQKGYFNNERLEREAERLDATLAKGRAEGSLEEAWRKIDHSFNDDQDAVLDGIEESLYKNIEYVSPATLNATVTLFKRFGRANRAANMIARYVEARGAEPELFELDGHPFGDLVNDPDVKVAFDTKAREPRETPDFVIVLETAKKNWTTEVIELLAAASVDDYRRAFKSSTGDAHRSLVYNALHFMDVGGVTPAMRTMTEKARLALLAIAQESAFNAYRAARFGVVDAAPPAAAAPEAPDIEA